MNSMDKRVEAVFVILECIIDDCCLEKVEYVKYQIERALEAYEQSRWCNDMSKAPKDGTEILLFALGKKSEWYRECEITKQKKYVYEDDCFCSGYYNTELKAWFKFQAGNDYEYQEERLIPTHWQHLTPPKE